METASFAQCAPTCAANTIDRNLPYTEHDHTRCCTTKLRSVGQDGSLELAVGFQHDLTVARHSAVTSSVFGNSQAAMTCLLYAVHDGDGGCPIHTGRDVDDELAAGAERRVEEHRLDAAVNKRKTQCHKTARQCG